MGWNVLNHPGVEELRPGTLEMHPFLTLQHPS
jgi:hypothetical protein